MTMSGMDIGEVRRTADFFARSSDRLEQIRLEIDIAVAARIWLGPRAVQFGADWLGTLRPLVSSAAADLQTAAGHLRTQADQQEIASGVRDQRANAITDFFRDSARQGLAVMGWAGDRVADGVGWVHDRVEDGLDWVVGGVVGRVKAGWDGLETHAEAWMQVAGSFSSPDGQPPTLSQLGAGIVLIGGTALAIPLNVLAGRDLHILDEGRAVVGTPEPLGNGLLHHSSRVTDGVPDGTTTPADFAAFTHETMETYDSGAVRITAIRQPGEPTRYIVAIPGTTDDLPQLIPGLGGYSGGEDDGLGWGDNFHLMVDGRSAASESVRLGILATIAADQQAHGESGGKPEIVLSGHSQGGMIASSLAADPAFRSQVDIDAVVTYGSPAGTSPIPSDIPVLDLQVGDGGLLSDPVPQLDLGAQRAGNQTTVVLPGTSIGPLNHYQQVYYDGVANLSGQNASTVAEFQERYLKDYLTSDPDQVSGYTVKSGRTVQD